MRLGQLARQLDIKTENIVSFLAKEKKITIKSHPNAKVDDKLIDEITSFFKPIIVAENLAEKRNLKTTDSPSITETKEVIVEEEKEALKTEVTEKIETIKSSFTSPKIVGKIDLPDKSKIDVEVDGVVYDQETLEKKQKEEREAKKIVAEKKQALKKEETLAKALAEQKKEAEQKRREELKLAAIHHDTHNVLTKKEEQQQKLKEQTRIKREEEIKKKQKLKRAENYKKKHAAKHNDKKSKKTKQIKQIEPSKKITEKIIEEKIIEEKIIEEVVESTPKEKNIFKRFLKWLNSE